MGAVRWFVTKDTKKARRPPRGRSFIARSASFQAKEHETACGAVILGPFVPFVPSWCPS